MRGTITFPFEDERWLHPGEREGGLAHVFDEVVDPAPLVVWLHGTNDRGPLHRGLGAKGFDLRTLVPTSFLVAGPSQTRDAASGSRLWTAFDLTRFVEAVEQATGRAIDRTRVTLVGHSGAGCNVAGGLLSPLGAVRPCSVVAIDTCLDARFGARFADLAREVPVHVFRQTRVWPREPRAFEETFGGPVVALDVPGDNPHDDIVPIALARVLSGAVEELPPD